MAKEIYNDEQLREKIMAGVDALADTIKVTLGPAGRNVVIDSQKAGLIKRTITNDGATIARGVNISDRAEFIGAQLVREVSTKTEDAAGDGTTTAVVLAQAILKEGYRMVAAGANPVELRKGIPVNMAEVEGEADYSFKASMQSLRYDVLFGRAPESELQVDPEELMAQIKEDLIHEQKENYILTKVIELEGFEATPEELLAEAEAMARRQNTTVEMVQSFFGKDLTGLTGDVKKRKAKEFLYSLATEG